jgi:hypothetical protein
VTPHVPRISVVVPATDDPETLDRCVAAIEPALDAGDELITVTEAQASGPAAARNEGAARAGGEILVFVDADVILHDDALDRIREAFIRDPRLTAIFGAYDADPEAPGAVSGFRNILHHHVHNEGAGPARTFWTGIGAVRRQAFIEVGGFDQERYTGASGMEDIDFGGRIYDAGGRIVLDAQIQGKHLKAFTLGSMVRTDFAARGVPWSELLMRRAISSGELDLGEAGALNLGWRHRTSAAAATLGLLALLMRRRWAAAGAAVVFVAANADLYLTIERSRGPGEALLAIPLHAIHHLTGVASVPVGLARAVLTTEPAPAPEHDVEEA